MKENSKSLESKMGQMNRVFEVNSGTVGKEIQMIGEMEEFKRKIQIKIE